MRFLLLLVEDELSNQTIERYSHILYKLTMDSRLAFAAEIADARRGTAEAIMKLEKELEREGERESTQREEWLIELGCLKNKLKREERHLNMVEAALAEGIKAPSPSPPTCVCVPCNSASA